MRLFVCFVCFHCSYARTCVSVCLSVAPCSKPTTWWEVSEDASLLIGTFRYGFGNYAAMCADESLTFGRKLREHGQQLPVADNKHRAPAAGSAAAAATATTTAAADGEAAGPAPTDEGAGAAAAAESLDAEIGDAEDAMDDEPCTSFRFILLLVLLLYLWRLALIPCNSHTARSGSRWRRR